jgi:hypothetical protein
MKSTLFLTALILSMTAAQARSEPPVRQQYRIPEATGVVIETVGEVDIRPGKVSSLTIEAEPRVLEALAFAVEKGILFLRSKGDFSTRHPVRYTVVVPRLQRLSSQGSGQVTASAFHGGEELLVEAAGSGDVALDGIESRRLLLRISGSGNIDAVGKGEALQAEISGAGEIRAERYPVARAEAKITGSGEIRLSANTRLEAVIEGAGDIRYGGNPEVIRRISGAGSVDPL